MHAASLLHTCIIHAKMAQHVYIYIYIYIYIYTQMLEFTVFKHNLPMQK